MSESDVPPVPPEDTPEVAQEPPPAADPPPFAAAEPAPGWDAGLSGSSGEALAERPEVLVGAAFAGGVVSALILKRLAR